MQEFFSIDGLNIANTCRTCLFQCQEQNSLFDIVGTSELTLAQILMAFTQLQIQENDNLPRGLCDDCTNQIINAYNFKTKAEQSEKVIYNYIANKKTKTATDMSSDELNDQVSIKQESEVIVETLVNNTEEIIKDEKHQPEDDSEVVFEIDQSESEAEVDDFKKTLTPEDLLLASEEEHSKEKYLKNTEYMEISEPKVHLPLNRTGVHTNSKKRKKAHPVGSTDILGLSDADESLCVPNGVKTIQCKICGSLFSKINNLKVHLKTHKSLDDIDFETMKAQSGANEDDVRSFMAKMAVALEKKQLSMFYSIVNEIGNELNLSDTESESETDDLNIECRRIHNCEICNEKFDRRYKAMYHQKYSHSYEELLHQCRHCLKKFISQDLLKDHLRAQCENTEKLLKCNECNKRYMWHENLSLHTNIHHSSAAGRVKKKELPREKSFTCKTCDKSFYRQEHLDRHTNIHQPDEKKFECPTCHKKFNRKDNMKSHMKIHREDREKEDSDKHLCVYCGRSFSNSSNLIVHMRRHTGEKPYKCDLCDKGFPRSSDLQCHRRTHTGEKPCLCTICGKGFSRSNKLARHMRIHTGVRPYKCTYCDRAFTQSNDLTLHIRRHTGDKPYVCGICGERFIQGTALHTHQRLKGHFEEDSQEAPYSSISVNNPNRANFASRVDRIGIPKNSNSQEPIEIKPVGKGSTLIALDKDVQIDRNNKILDEGTNNVSAVSANPNIQTIENISNFVQSKVPYNPTSAFIATTNVPFIQLEDGDFFTIPNLGSYH